MTYQHKKITMVNHTYHWTQLVTSYQMNFFNLGAPKLIPYAYKKLTDSLFKRWYTRSINHCSQLSTTWLSDHGSHTISRWFLLGLWGDGVIKVLSAVCFHLYVLNIYLSSYLFLCACTLKGEGKPIYFQNHNLSLSNRLPFISYAGNILGKTLNMMPNTLELMSHYFMLIYWAS